MHDFLADSPTSEHVSTLNSNQNHRHIFSFRFTAKIHKQYGDQQPYRRQWASLFHKPKICESGFGLHGDGNRNLYSRTTSLLAPRRSPPWPFLL